MADLTSLLQQALKTSAGSSVVNAGASLIPATPKRRAAVVGHDAFMALDTYQATRPTLFWGGLGVAAGAGVMLWLRRRHGVEAWASWGSMSTLGLLIAWLTRPGAAGSAPAAADGSSASQNPMAATYRWLDARAAQLDRSEPGWEDRALARLLG